jgi:hypothetical protein
MMQAFAAVVPGHTLTWQPGSSRSTLDPVLRGETRGIDWRLLPVAAMAGLYMFATPGESRWW